MSSSLGWFGDPWPSYVCYDEDGNLRDSLHLPFPAGGSRCSGCGELIAPGDSGEMVVVSRTLRFVREYVHKECQLLAIIGGSFADLDPARGAQNLPKRQEALAVWDWVLANGADAAFAAAS